MLVFWGWYPSCLTPLLEPVKRGYIIYPNEYPLFSGVDSGLIFKVPTLVGLGIQHFPYGENANQVSRIQVNQENRSNHSNDSLIFNFPIYLVHQGYSYLIYWQLGGWFQILRELEDQGIAITWTWTNSPPEKVHHFKRKIIVLQASFFMRHV